MGTLVLIGLYGLVDLCTEPFAYGSALFILSYRWTRAPWAKLLTMVFGVFLFILWDDVCMGYVTQRAGIGYAIENSTLWEEGSDAGSLGSVEFESGVRSGLHPAFRLGFGDIASASLFIPAAFLAGLWITRRRWDERPREAVFRRGSGPAPVLPPAVPGTTNADTGAGPVLHVMVNGTEQRWPLPDVNTRLLRRELTGQEPAWTYGLAEWVPLKRIPGVVRFGAGGAPPAPSPPRPPVEFG